MTGATSRAPSRAGGGHDRATGAAASCGQAARADERGRPRGRASNASSRPRRPRWSSACSGPSRSKTGRTTRRTRGVGGAGAHRPAAPARRDTGSPPPPPRSPPRRTAHLGAHPRPRPTAAMLDEAIASVRNQTYANWELCLVDDGSTNPEIITALATPRRLRPPHPPHPPRHPPRHLRRPPTPPCDLATGDYIALLDHDDTLTPDALQHIADRITTDPTLDMLYTDEDMVADDGSFARHIKPGWSPDHMTALMYTCHLGVYRRALAVELGGFRLALRRLPGLRLRAAAIERTDRIAHIPRILYHWRAHADSTAGGEQAKPYAYLAQPAAIAEHLERSGIDAEVSSRTCGPAPHRPSGRARRPRWISCWPSTTPTGSREAAASWLAQPHPALAASCSPRPRRSIDDASRGAHRRRASPSDRITARPRERAARRRRPPPPPSTSCSCRPPPPASPTTGSPACSATAPSPASPPPDPSSSPPTGASTRPASPSPTASRCTSQPPDRVGSAPRVVHNVSAVSGILATPRDTYEQLGGLDPSYGELALIDYCLRAGRAPPPHRHRPRRPPAHHRPRPHHQRPPHPLAPAQHLGPHPHPRPLLQPQLPHRPRRLRPPALRLRP